MSWLSDDVPELYDTNGGRPSIDPEVAVRLRLAGFLLGIDLHQDMILGQQLAQRPGHE